ncbi:MAG: phosphonate ABC transporter, permease protein PhnE [Spirochaeta sp.]
MARTPQQKERIRQARITARSAVQKPLVSPILAAVLSLIIPGLGQILSRQTRRGLLILSALATGGGIFAWRVADLGRRVDGFFPSISRALERNPGFVILAGLTIALVWLVTAWDAFLCSRNRKRPISGVFALLFLTYFILGWQIAEIDVVKLVRQAPEALPPLSRVIWPWSAAITYDTESLTAEAEILAGEGAPPERAEPKQDEPYLLIEPNTGRMSSQDENFRPVTGTRITVTGTNFEPNTETEIWWRDPLGNQFRPREDGQYLIFQTDDEGSFQFEMTMPYRMGSPSAEGPFLHTVEARQVSRVGLPKASEALKLTINRMIETIFMGMMATFFGIIFSIPVSFLAARNIMSGSRLTMALYYLTRTILNIIRSIEPLIWALIAVVWVGLGPFAGIVALTLHSIAALGKLYSEAIEGIDAGPIEAIQATGANRLQTIMFGVIPQMISPFISFSIYRWDINVRMSTVIGLVGGGGIGFLLVQYIRLLDYRSAGIAVWFIAITVATLDYISAEIRNRLM